MRWHLLRIILVVNENDMTRRYFPFEAVREATYDAEGRPMAFSNYERLHGLTGENSLFSSIFFLEQKLPEGKNWEELEPDLIKVLASNAWKFQESEVLLIRGKIDSTIEVDADELNHWQNLYPPKGSS